MSFLSKIFASGAGTLVDSVGGVIDSIHTSTEEKLELKKAIDGQLQNFELEMEKVAMEFEGEVSKRHLADMTSDSWLSKNIRPLALIFLLTTTMGLAYGTIFGEVPERQREMLEAWIPLLIALDTAAVGFYFGGRSFEKGRKLNGN